MAVRDFPLAMIAFSGVVAVVAYGLIRLINERRFYKDLVCCTALSLSWVKDTSVTFVVFSLFYALDSISSASYSR